MNTMSFETRQNLIIGLRYALLILISAIFIFPIVFMVVSSLKPDIQLLRDSGSLRAFLPVGDISLNNYADAFERVPMVQFAFNSIFTTVVSVCASILLNSMAAFSFAFLKWRGKAIVLSLIIATFIVPFEVVAIPMLLIANNLPWIGPNGIEIGWLNSYHVQIIPFIADSLGIFLFYQYFRDLPDELVEAARIDGASIWQIYARIIMPIAGPILATVAILKFLTMWNAYLWPLMTIRSEELRPIMVGLQYFFQLNTAWGEIMAYLSVVTIPVLIFYLALQRAFIESIATSGIKG